MRIDQIHAQTYDATVSLSTASIVKGPQAGASAWPHTATDGFLMLAWTLGVKEANEPNWNRPAMLPSAGIAREINSTGEHVQRTAFGFFTHDCRRRWKSSVGCCISGGFCFGGENRMKKTSFTSNQILRNMYNNCSAFRVKAATCVCDYAAGKYSCISSLFLLWTLCKRLQMHKPESVCVVLVY